MKKMLATMMVISVSLALLSGCGSKNGSTNTASSNNDTNTETEANDNSNAAVNEATYSMRISHAVAETHPSHQTLLEFEKAVEEGTNGAVQVELIPNGALGGGDSACRNGSAWFFTGYCYRS